MCARRFEMIGGHQHRRARRIKRRKCFGLPAIGGLVVMMVAWGQNAWHGCPTDGMCCSSNCVPHASWNKTQPRTTTTTTAEKKKPLSKTRTYTFNWNTIINDSCLSSSVKWNVVDVQTNSKSLLQFSVNHLPHTIFIHRKNGIEEGRNSDRIAFIRTISARKKKQWTWPMQWNNNRQSRIENDFQQTAL